MTPEQADKRIILSRQTLHRYADMTRAGQWPIADLPLMVQEVALLEEIAEMHQGKALKIEVIVEGWRAMIEAVRGKLN